MGYSQSKLHFVIIWNTVPISTSPAHQMPLRIWCRPFPKHSNQIISLGLEDLRVVTVLSIISPRYCATQRKSLVRVANRPTIKTQ